VNRPIQVHRLTARNRRADETPDALDDLAGALGVLDDLVEKLAALLGLKTPLR
jgi:hypothetical protein